jgi:hypothetical protein
MPARLAVPPIRRHWPPMLLIINVLAFFGAVALAAAAVAWWKVVRYPSHGASQERADLDFRRVESAARITAIAFGLCALAAMVGIADWFML